MRWQPLVAGVRTSGIDRAGSVRMFGFFSTRLGCIGSIAVSIIGTLLLMFILHGCNSSGQIGLLAQP